MRTRRAKSVFCSAEFSRNGTEGAWLSDLQMVLPTAAGLHFSPNPQEENNNPIPSPVAREQLAPFSPLDALGVKIQANTDCVELIM